MILRLKERYKYNKVYLKQDLKTYLMESSSIEHYEIDLLKEVIELESNEQFMKTWKEEGSKKHCKYKYCLSQRLDLPTMDMIEINDYENARWATDGELMPCNMVVFKVNSIKDCKVLLLDRRRWSIEILNDNNVKMEDF